MLTLARFLLERIQVPSAVDLFAGAGGWSVACRRLGIPEIGVELDSAACATRLEAGFATLRCSVRGLDPRASSLDSDLLLKSPPCQTFSTAGGGAGRAELDLICAAVRNGEWDRPTSDPRSKLVLEPLRWIMLRHRAGRPYRGIAGEQVPPVLPVWKAYVEVLEQMGYSATCGVLSSECYGVAQTRKRAILVARLDGGVKLPVPTHSRYHSRDPKRLDPGVLPWVSMAEALAVLGTGWSDEMEVVSNYGSGGDPADRGVRGGAEPSATITGKVNRNKIRYRTSTMANATVRDSGVPAPTIAFGNDAASAGWVYSAGNRPNSAERAENLPAPTILGNGERGTHAKWVNPSDPEQGWVTRVSVQEAAVLQSFPPDHPWQGTLTEQFQQVGNAIPPLMAEAILREIM